MKAARQQSLDLETADVMLKSVMSPEASQSKLQPEQRDFFLSSRSNTRARSLRLDSAARFAEPPAPPPQQPLPEKPDAVQSSPAGSSTFSFLKRSDTAKAPLNTAGSPHSPHNSQILSLVEALSIAKKELDSQAARVKQLEDMLRQERSARENAEDKARRLEQHPTSGLVVEDETTSDRPITSIPLPVEAIEATQAADESTIIPEPVPQTLQQHLDSMVSEMQRMQTEIHRFQTRAETAENDATKARKSLSEMIAKLREQNVEAADEEEVVEGKIVPSQFDHFQDDETSLRSSGAVAQPKSSFDQMNGHARPPSQMREPLERALATVMREGQGAGEGLAQSAPYVSMLGVMLIGVGLMAYLNSWQKTDG